MNLSNDLNCRIRDTKNRVILVKYLEKAMATHCSTLAWRIPGTGEPGGLLSVGSHRVGHDRNDLAAAAAAKYYPEQTVFYNENTRKEN